MLPRARSLINKLSEGLSWVEVMKDAGDDTTRLLLLDLPGWDGSVLQQHVPPGAGAGPGGPVAVAAYRLCLPGTRLRV